MESRRSRSAYGFFTFHLPPSTWFGRQTSVLRVLLGIGGGLFFNFYLKEIGSIRLAAFIINSMAFFSFFSTTIP